MSSKNTKVRPDSRARNDHGRAKFTDDASMKIDQHLGQQINAAN